MAKNLSLCLRRERPLPFSSHSLSLRTLVLPKPVYCTYALYSFTRYWKFVYFSKNLNPASNPTTSTSTVLARSCPSPGNVNMSTSPFPSALSAWYHALD